MKGGCQAAVGETDADSGSLGPLLMRKQEDSHPLHTAAVRCHVWGRKLCSSALCCLSLPACLLDCLPVARPACGVLVQCLSSAIGGLSHCDGAAARTGTDVFAISLAPTSVASFSVYFSLLYFLMSDFQNAMGC